MGEDGWVASVGGAAAAENWGRLGETAGARETGCRVRLAAGRGSCVVGDSGVLARALQSVRRVSMRAGGSWSVERAEMQ